MPSTVININVSDFGAAILNSADPSAVSFIRINADNSVSLRTPTETRSDIGAEPIISAGLNTQYWRGDKSWQTLNTDVVTEASNLYYTQNRFDTAFGNKTTTNLAEGLNLYYTAARFNSAFGAKSTSDLSEGINLYFTEDRTRDTDLAGLSITGGSITATDSVLSAFGKLQNQIAGLLGGAIVQGVWNATTNTPALASGVGTTGYYYVVNVAGSTNLDGITDWKVGDWAIFINGVWNKVDNTDAVSSVNGYVGTVSLVKADIGLGNVENTALSTWAGSTNITTLGTIGTGTWHGSAITETYLSITDVTTGNVSNTAHGFFPKLTSNSIYYVNNSGVLTALTVGAAGTVLTGNGVTSAPTWNAASSGITVGSTTISSGGNYQVLFQTTGTGLLASSSTFRYNSATQFLDIGTIGTGGYKQGGQTVLQYWSFSGPSFSLSLGGSALTSGGTVALVTFGSSSCSAANATLVGSRVGVDGSGPGSQSTLIGYRAAGGAYSIALGYYSGNTTNRDNCIVIGAEATTTATRQGILGSNTINGYINDWYFNGVTSATLYPIVLNAHGGSGTNNAGANLTLAAGKSTGSATPAVINFQSTAAGASSSTAQTLATVLQITNSTTITTSDAVNYALGSTTGTKFGTANTQKLAFWNATPIVQPSSANQAALTNSTGGTYNGTLVDVGAVFSQANINDNFTDICTLLNEVRNVLVNTGLMKGSA